MKILKTLCLVCLAVITINCSKKDDDNNPTQKTNKELLTTGKWYQESKSFGTYSACEKKTNIQFKTDDTLKLEAFDENSGSCQSTGIENATYTLTDNTNLTITFGPDTINTVILSISETELTLKNEQNETLIFDKTEG